MKDLAEDPDAKELTNDRVNFPELNQGSSIDYIHGYIYGFQFAASNGLKYKENIQI